MLSRRNLLLMGGAGLLSMSRSQSTSAQTVTPQSLNPVFKSFKRPPYLGTTFSPLQCYYLGVDYRSAFQEICQLGLDRIRLGAYWNEIERSPRQFDFAQLDWLLEEAHRNKITVALAVGMKVPRWPEFHFPKWVSDQYDTKAGDRALDLRSPKVVELSLKFVEAVANHCRYAPAIQYWQVENEPFTQLEIAGGRFLSPEFVKREVALVRSLAWRSQKILLTNAIHLPTPKLSEDLPAFKDSLDMADAVGFNVYTKVPAGNSGNYLEPEPAFWDQLQTWQQELVRADREAWIAEAQAEPWEPQKLVANDKADYPSASPRRMQLLVDRLARANYSTVLLWGSEYWYWQKTQGRNLWWWTVKQMIRSSI
jgi:Beta-galactosidase